MEPGLIMIIAAVVYLCSIWLAHDIGWHKGYQRCWWDNAEYIDRMKELTDAPTEIE